MAGARRLALAQIQKGSFLHGGTTFRVLLASPTPIAVLQFALCGPVAQLVEQRIENPRVSGSIPLQATSLCGL